MKQQGRSNKDQGSDMPHEPEKENYKISLAIHIYLSVLGRVKNRKTMQNELQHGFLSYLIHNHRFFIFGD